MPLAMPRLASLAFVTLAACTQVPAIVAPSTPAGAGLTVTGSATVGVRPDCADLALAVVTEAPVPSAAIAAAQARQAAVVEALRAAGVAPGELTLSQIAVSPVYQPVAAPPRYQARIAMTATTRAFDRIGALLDAAAGAGASELSTRFRNDDLPALRREVRARALADAQDRAQRTAAALGVPLGRLTAVADGGRGLATSVYFQPPTGDASELGADVEPLTIDVTLTYALPSG